ncbi:hypothetical protein ACOSQ2_014606 [Xanthoceras sorbifolium]
MLSQDHGTSIAPATNSNAKRARRMEAGTPSHAPVSRPNNTSTNIVTRPSNIARSTVTRYFGFHRLKVLHQLKLLNQVKSPQGVQTFQPSQPLIPTASQPSQPSQKHEY